MQRSTLDPVATRRTGLIWIHIICGSTAAGTFLSQANLSLKSVFIGELFWSGTNGMRFALPALWPYVVSFMTSRKIVPVRSSYLAIYTVVLAVATAAGVWVTLTTESLAVVFFFSVVQAMALVFTAEKISAYDWVHRDA
jgi:sorbitol-specific phosphotransferase system component IIBC